MASPAPRRIHIVGVGGPGTSAIAIILREMGCDVSGSDVRESPILDRLRAMGVRVNVPHDVQAVNGCDVVAHSAAIRATNIELVAARAADMPVWSRSATLAWIAEQARTVAVAGTHGKTTTTTLLTLMLRAAGRDPGYLIGADVPQLRHSAHWGSDVFVVEADESDSSHRAIAPQSTILTNVDIDHLDEHGSFAGIVASFDAYLAAVKGIKVVCADDLAAVQLARRYGAITYGVGDPVTGAAADGGSVDVRATDVRFVSGGAQFTVVSRHGPIQMLVPLRGEHNVRNCLAAFTMAVELGVTPQVAADALRDFRGVQRRFEVRATHGGATFVDDYAHLPAEIAAVLGAVRADNTHWRRVVAVFQPNRFNRMAVMSDAYRDAFVDADVVVVTDIYASGTDRIAGVSGQLVVDAIRAAHPAARVEWQASRDELVNFVAREVRDGDVCISMGCGDIETLPDEVVVRRRELAHGR
ncbi:MAG: UDP-N-acetylmuramate--L-alanine ligase [Ilumatobacteraceae bacterium]|nr:UDP-N-acetylmuramate--L-alanine ligase [Ilumatobacteraceae bacterium]